MWKKKYTYYFVFLAQRTLGGEVTGSGNVMLNHKMRLQDLKDIAKAVITKSNGEYSEVIITFYSLLGEAFSGSTKEDEQ